MACSPIQKSLQRAMLCFFLIFMFAFTSLGVARLVHYHRQNTLLIPSDYTADVVTSEDYQKLSDPVARTVTLANGSTIMKGDAFDAKHYQPIDGGNRYIFIMLTGTAPMMPLLYRTLFPLLLLAIVGLFFTYTAIKRCQSQDAKGTV